MTALDQFRSYLDSVARRLRWRALGAGSAATVLCLFALTVGLAELVDRFEFSPPSLFWARWLIFTAGGGVIAAVVVVALLRVSRRAAARAVESRVAGFDERALTLAGSETENPFHELVAEQALDEARLAPPESLVGSTQLAAGFGAAAVLTAALVGFVTLAPGTLGYGARLLWTGPPAAGSAPLYQVSVKPGDAKVRRGGDQVIEAFVNGFSPDAVNLRARAAGSTDWQTLRMQRRAGAAGWAFLLAGLTGDLDYQVDAGRARSPQYHLSAIDLPALKRLSATYHYPAYLGLRDSKEDPAGDLRAVVGTSVDLTVELDRRLDAAALILDSGTRIPLSALDGTRLQARVPIEKDGAYYVAALDGSAPVRLSGDYFIEARPDAPPTVRITRPGRDAKVSPIEEVTVEVESTDDFALAGAELKYSVNGGPEQTVKLPANARDSHGSIVLALEQHSLSAGDIVALYAVARDARSTARTDIFFLEAQPFEREYQQSQTMGGGGGGEGGQQDDQIAQRQKEIVAATWNQLRSAKNKAQSEEDAALLSGIEQKLAEQARSLAQRMRSRQLAGTNEEFQRFSREMDEAARDMLEARPLLAGERWRDALAPEQRALQHLLRAESTFRQIQVAFGQRGGGGAGSGRGRDLESLFDLELDTEKNQYETAQSGAEAGKGEREIDEALKKLEELARRQQQLAAEQPRHQQNFEQRWAQEMLRREAEQLRRQMDSLSRQGSSQSSDPRLGSARDQLNRALDDMRQAQQSGGESVRRAAERMQQAEQSLGRMRSQQAGERLDDIARRAAELAERQQQFQNDLNQAYPNPAAPTAPQQPGGPGESLARQKDAMQREWQRLEQQMKDAAQALDSSRKAAASRLRDALGEAQQSELGLRLKYGAEWLRMGLGPRLAPRERATTEALDRLSRQASQARELARQPGAGEARQQAAGQALERMEQLRERLRQQLPNAPPAGSQPGNQPGRQPGGQQGIAGLLPGLRNFPQPQRGRFGGPRGQPQSLREEMGAMSDGLHSGDAPRSAQPGLESTLDDVLAQLRQLRHADGVSPDAGADIDRLIRDMQRLDPRRAGGDATLQKRIHDEVLPQFEQLELRLHRELGATADSQVHLSPTAKAPPGYAGAVADYFRRLNRAQ